MIKVYNFFNQNKKLFFFLLLYFFHLILSSIIFYIAKTDYLIHFHNGDGIWNLYPDVSSYHFQALRVYDYIAEGKIGIIEFLTNTIPDIYNNNRNIKWLALI